MYVHSSRNSSVTHDFEADHKLFGGPFNSKGGAPRHSFSIPYEVIDDPSLNRSEKRAILAEWASDACAVESFPALRRLPGANFPVTLSSIMDALSLLDEESGAQQIGGTAFAPAPMVTQCRSSRFSAAPSSVGSLVAA